MENFRQIPSASVYFCGPVAVGSMLGSNAAIVAHPFIPLSDSRAFGNQHVEPDTEERSGVLNRDSAKDKMVAGFEPELARVLGW